MTRRPAPPSREVFARNMWRLRTERGLTQAQLGGKIGWRRAAGRVSQIESDKHNPTLDTVDLVAEALGVSAAQMLTPQDGTP